VKAAGCAPRTDAEELELLDEYLIHGRAVARRSAGARSWRGEAPDFVALVRGLGRG